MKLLWCTNKSKSLQRAEYRNGQERENKQILPVSQWHAGERVSSSATLRPQSVGTPGDKGEVESGIGAFDLSDANSWIRSWKHVGHVAGRLRAWSGCRVLRALDFCFEDRAVSTPRTKWLGLSAVPISSYLPVCLSCHRCSMGVLTHPPFHKTHPFRHSNEQVHQNLVNQWNGVSGSDMPNADLQGSLPSCS